jgi:hypothetical protein
LRWAVGEVDGQQMVIILGQTADGWVPQAMVNFDIADGRIVRIADYIHCPWILSAARSVTVNLS